MDVGVTWYTENEWANVRAAAVDPERFEATYAEWVVMAEKALKDMLAAGIVAHKVPIKADELLAWCLAHNLYNNAAARAQYVSHLGQRTQRSAA